jgi:hypothetical protein
VSTFQVKEFRPIELDKGKSKVFRFQLQVPGSNSADAFLCTRLFVSQGTKLPFNTVGLKDLFCIIRSAQGFSVASSLDDLHMAQNSVTAASTGTELEPNNSCQTAQDVGAVSLPYVLDGNLDSSAGPDIDFYRLSGTAGALLAIDHEGQSTGKGTLSDPYLGVFDSNCNLIAVNDDSGSTNSHVEITVPSDGVLVLGATFCCDSSFSGGGEGSYQLTVAPVQLIGSIAGRITDGFNGAPLRGDVDPFAYVSLLQCDEFGCRNINSQPADSEGRFLFTSHFNGTPLRPGNYKIVVSAYRFLTRETELFAVGNAENYDLGDFALTPHPVRFSDIQPCAIPAEGGVCNYSLRITNTQSTRLLGKAWSMVNGFGTGSLASLTTFQTELERDVRLNAGQSTTLRFQFRVPSSVTNGALICAVVYVGENPNALLQPLGLEPIFCLNKGQGGFTLLSGAEAQAAAQQAQMQMQEWTLPDPFTSRK